MFLPRRLSIIVQYLIFARESGRVNILSGNDVACIAAASALCLKNKREIRGWTKES
jgi:hypothetical protein